MDILAYQAEYVLDRRTTPIQKSTGTAGAIFNNILQMTNGVTFNDKIIKSNNVYIGGVQREETLGNSALSHISAVAERSGNDFDISYILDDNRRLRLVGNWYQTKGLVTNKYLREGHNIELTDNVLIEDARELANWVEGRGDASTGASRMSATRYNEASIAQYGLYQTAEVFSGNTVQATLNDNTLNKLKALLNPARSFDLTALNISDTFDFLDIGNIHNLDLNCDGFEEGHFGTRTQVRTLGMSVDTTKDTCRLITEEYTTDAP